MCGIAGFFAATPQPAALLKDMTDLIRHRGPDDEGFTLLLDNASPMLACGGDDTPESAYASVMPFSPTARIDALGNTPVRLALGHRRLAIVDLTPFGHQPMSYAAERYWIVYNGEIYNHIELRAELEGLGHQFASHSDTEVILAAYMQWGEQCLNRFNGMFAFALYDRACQTLFLARDRFGVKPLYYWVSPHGAFYFASEIKQFTCLPGWRAKINGQRAYDFLAFGVSDHSDETLFAGVFQLAPGYKATLSLGNGPAWNRLDGRIPSQQWYELQARPFSGSYNDACARFRELFYDAVQLRLRADVEIGSCLSGGLDSSSIVCVMNQLLHEKNAAALQKTFSACSDVAKYDERAWIDTVVNQNKISAHYVYPSLENLFEESPSITWHQDEPFGSSSIYAQWNVFRLAADNGVTVMLDGQGSDEQLAGYYNFFGPHLGTLFRQLRWGSLANEMKAIRKLHGFSFFRSGQYIAEAVLPEFAKNQIKKKVGLVHSKPDWLDLSQLRAIANNPMFSLGATGAATVRDLSIAQLTASNLQMLLHWEDRDSMAHSIESRVPFLDYRLVEFVLGLPDDYKLAGGITKRVLRDAMTGILPDSIRNRMDKLGFATPEEIWIRERSPQLFKNKLKNAIDQCGGILKPTESMKLLDRIIDGAAPYSSLPWRMINFGEWLSTFSVEIE